MKTNIYATCLIAFTLLLNDSLLAQSTTANNLTGANKFIGYNGAQDVDLRTNNVTRMRLRRATGSLTVNNQLVDLSGNLAIGLNLSPSLLPLSRLHIVTNTSVPLVDGYRSWILGSGETSLGHRSKAENFALRIDFLLAYLTQEGGKGCAGRFFGDYLTSISELK
jgi:hypothetical protein